MKEMNLLGSSRGTSSSTAKGTTSTTVYVLRTKEGQYYNGKLGDHYEMLTTYKMLDAHLCDSLAAAKVLVGRDKRFDVIPCTFNIEQDTLNLARELRAAAIRAGKEPSQNDCLFALEGLDLATAREKFAEIIDRL